MKHHTLQTYRSRLLRVVQHIHEHLDQEINLDELADLSHFSSYHFHRIFRALIGEPVHQYVRRLRLEFAAVRLKQTDTPVIEIAFNSGYESHESFSRAFKAMFGASPSQFRAQRAAAALRQVEAWRDTNPGESPMKVAIKHLTPRPIAFVPHIGPYKEVGPAFDTLMAWAAPRGLLCPGVQILGVCYDDPTVTPSGKIRYEAAITVDDEVEPEGEVGVRTLPGGDHAVICHQGPYQELSNTYDCIYGQWLPTSGREPADDPCFEVYLNDPEGTDPEDLLTDIYIPLT